MSIEQKVKGVWSVLSGTVIIAHGDMLLADGVERVLSMNHPGIHIEKTRTGKEALIMQSLMRADAVLMAAELTDMTGEHLIQELRRDIARPYIILCMRERSIRSESSLIRGADCCISAPVDIVRVCDLISEQLERRAGMSPGGGLPEMMLQRLFVDNGIPCDLKGYVFLKYALTLLHSGRSNLNSMRILYEQIGERFGCGSGAVEHGIRYAVALCMKRIETNGHEKMSNRQFIARLIEESEIGMRTMVKPRVSVFCSGRRVFR